MLLVDVPADSMQNIIEFQVGAPAVKDCSTIEIQNYSVIFYTYLSSFHVDGKVWVFIADYKKNKGILKFY